MGARTRIPTSVPWRQLSAEHRGLILEGDSENDYEGVKGFFSCWSARNTSCMCRVFLSRYRGYATCRSAAVRAARGSTSGSRGGKGDHGSLQAHRETGARVLSPRSSFPKAS